MMCKSAVLPDTYVEVRLSDISHDSNSDDSPISYAVRSNDQDWTFVTASTIDERLNKVKTSPAIRVMTNPKVYRFIPMLCMLIIILYTFGSLDSMGSGRIETIRKIRASSSNMWDYVYRVDTIKTKELDTIAYLPYLLIGFTILSIAIDFIMKPILRWYPTYTFYWGDRVKSYDLKMSVVKFLFGSIVLAIILGVVGNFAYDRIK